GRVLDRCTGTPGARQAASAARTARAAASLEGGTGATIPAGRAGRSTAGGESNESPADAASDDAPLEGHCEEGTPRPRGRDRAGRGARRTRGCADEKQRQQDWRLKKRRLQRRHGAMVANDDLATQSPNAERRH